MLHALEATDRLAELLARERVLHRHVEAAARAAVGIRGEEDETSVARAIDRRAARRDPRGRRAGELDRVETAGEVGAAERADLDPRCAVLDEPEARPVVVMRPDDDRL